MNAKPSPLSNLKSISPEQADQLFELLRSTPYHAAVAWVAERWGIPASVAGLQRWWKRETARRARSDLRNAIAVSSNFDSSVDARQLDSRAANALRAALWGALTTRDNASIETLAKLVLDYNADARNTDKAARLLQAEKQLEQSKADAEALRKRADELTRQLAEAGKANAADPAAVSAQLDHELGVTR